MPNANAAKTTEEGDTMILFYLKYIIAIPIVVLCAAAGFLAACFVCLFEIIYKGNHALQCVTLEWVEKSKPGNKGQGHT